MSWPSSGMMSFIRRLQVDPSTKGLLYFLVCCGSMSGIYTCPKTGCTQPKLISNESCNFQIDFAKKTIFCIKPATSDEYQLYSMPLSGGAMQPVPTLSFSEPITAFSIDTDGVYYASGQTGEFGKAYFNGKTSSIVNLKSANASCGNMVLYNKTRVYCSESAPPAPPPTTTRPTTAFSRSTSRAERLACRRSRTISAASRRAASLVS